MSGLAQVALNLLWALHGGSDGARLRPGEAESSQDLPATSPRQAARPVSELEEYSGWDGEIEAWRVRGLPKVSHSSGRTGQWSQARCPALGSFPQHLTEPLNPVADELFSPLFCRCSLNPGLEDPAIVHYL